MRTLDELAEPSISMFNRQTLAFVVIGLLALFTISALSRRYNSRNTPSTGAGMSYTPPFYEQWMRQHEAYPYACWTETGYDATQSPFSRDIQLLAAMDYGKSDIDNGGFHQFFYNETGIFAPEMVEWCDRNDLTDVALILREAMSFFGNDYPRNREQRVAKLPEFQPRRGSEWDPFDNLNEQFYAALSNNGTRYEDAADRWVKINCSVSSLDDVERGRTMP